MGSAQAYKQLHRVAPSMGVQLRSLKIRKAADIDTTFTAIKKPLAALVIVADPISNSNRPKIADLAAKTKIPAIYGARSWVEDGGLMSYGTDLVESSRRSASYVDKILKGVKPADLPVEQPTKFELVINLKAAKQIGLTILPNVLARADRVIR